MNAVTLLEKYFTTPAAREIIIVHGMLVAAKALQVARCLNNPLLDLQFVEEAALLHDIGVCRTAVPDIGCFGSEPYIRHGVIGREILEAEGMPRHALVCERHIGVGLTIEDIRAQRLPLPERDMKPLSLEERIVCFADLFYSKKPERATVEKSLDKIKKGLARYGEEKTEIFEKWFEEFTCRG